MPITFACPHCKRNYQVADEMAGKAVKCQSCQNAIHVPAGASAAAPQMQKAAPITFNCQSCGRQYQVAAGMAGKQAKCQSCQAVMQVPPSNAAASEAASGGSLNSLFDEVTETDLSRWQGSPQSDGGATYSPHSSDLSAASPSGGPKPKKGGPKPKNYFVESILLFLFMGGVFAIPAIIAASKVDSLYGSGDYRGAVEASKNAKKWCIIAGCIGGGAFCLGLGVALVATVVGALAAS